MKLKKAGLAAVGLWMLTACTAINVQPVERDMPLLHVCIQENERVMVSDFLWVLREGFDRHAVSTETFSGKTPAHCEFVLRYTARQSWDFAPYLAYAELWLERSGQPVAQAQYRLRGKGGLSLMKWQGTQSKMNPVIDRLLQFH